MTGLRSTGTVSTSWARNLRDAARHYVGGRRGLLALAAFALAAGLALNWRWLVAAGIAPLLLSALPCIAMCALGLCVNKVAGRSCAPDTAPRGSDNAARESAKPVAAATVAEVPGDRADDSQPIVALASVVAPQPKLLAKTGSADE